MSPTLDDSFTVPRLTPASKTRCGPARFDPGGGGINVARVLHVLGEPSTAVFPVGGYLGQYVQHLLGLEGIATAGVPVHGETRQSHHVVDQETGLEYRFVLPGAPLPVEDQRRCLRALREQAANADYVVLSGSFPAGVAPDFVLEVAALARDVGARLVLDTSGEALARVRNAYLVKPSVRELEELVGHQLEQVTEQVRAAREFLCHSGSTAVVLSRGQQGVVLVTDTYAETIAAHSAEVISTVGAGDALVAGIVAGLCRDWDLPRATRFGVACSAAMTETAGTALFTIGELRRFSHEEL
ncbi:1-phosphofructokinase family hexose kinase [Nocardioides sp. R-N-C8]|nr:1-phosphofructokinase family hexose kinase [Nocardioides nematodiphilus]